MEPVAEILPRLNYGLAPRAPGCWVCRNVTHPEDVTTRLVDAEGRHRPHRDAIEYLAGIGHSAAKRSWDGRLRRHRQHVERSMTRTLVVTPAHLETDRVSRIEPVGGSPTWLRTTDRAVDLGAEALESLKGRLDEMEDADLIAVARLGQAAAAKLGDWEAKGRQLGQMDKLMHLAFGPGPSNGD